MIKEDFEKLKNRVWTTKTSRINAERRLELKESFIQGINIYYSCICTIFSVLSLINGDQKLSVMTVFITIALFMAILYSNSQKNLEQAKDYKINYLQLMDIDFELQHITCEDEKQIREIETKYCEILNRSRNHIEFDYYRTVYSSTGDYRKERWIAVRKMYYWNVIWRWIVKIIVILFPIIVYVLCEVL